MLFSEFVKKVEEFEGFSATPYRCPAGVLTIGYGFTASSFNTGRVPDYIDKLTAEKLLEEKLDTLYADVEKKVVKWYGDQPVDVIYALTDFTFNCGSANLVKLCQNGKRELSLVKEKIMLYNKSKGKTLAGLTKRRAWEKEVIEQATEKKVVSVAYVQKILNRDYGCSLVEDGICGKKTLSALIDVLERW